MRRRDFLSTTTIGAAAMGLTPARAAFMQAGAPPSIKMLPRPTEGRIRVACAISKGTTEIDWIGPQAVFQTWHRNPETHRPEPKFEIVTVAQSLEPIDKRIPDYTFETLRHAHVVVVPAQNGSPALLDWLRQIHKTADVTMSVCIGARHLAAAGILDGLPATTHHESIASFEKEFPAVRWIRDVRFVENERLSTAAGLTSGIDLALHVVDRYFGRAAAQQVADHIEHEGKRWMV